jgi:hypothetical protein
MKKTLIALAFVAALPAFAVDGIVLINQSTVMSAGGFPYTISSPGSYRLSGNLVVPDANTTAIKITASNVTIDLNGFSILGPTVCTGYPATTCSPAGQGSGIDGTYFNPSTGSGLSNITVTNGIVKGMGAYGVSLDGCFGCNVEKITASHSGTIGILIYFGRVSDNTASYNGLRGIQNGYGPMLNNLAMFNKEYGILANCPGSVIGNVAVANGTNLVINGISCAAANNSVGN